MSSHPNQLAGVTAPATIPMDAMRLPVTMPRLAEKHRLGEKLVMVTAYDFPSARAAEAAAVDLVLVGDSGAMTVLVMTPPSPSRSRSCSRSRRPCAAA